MKSLKDKETVTQQTSNPSRRFNIINENSRMFFETHTPKTDYSSLQCPNIVWKCCLFLLQSFALLGLIDGAFSQGIIIYSSEVGGQFQLFKTDESWRQPDQLTKGAMSAEKPAFSWDGRKIAFVGSDQGKIDIYWMDSDGQNMEQLTNTPEMELWPRFSPDGKRLIFTRGNTLETTMIVSIDLSPKAERILFKGLHATYSPDGQWIAFVSVDKGNWEIFKTPVNEFAPINLSNHPAQDATPAYSLDGQWIAFASERHGGTLKDIYKMHADGTKITRLTFGLGGELSFPVWSPSGEQILFQSNLQKIYRMNSDGRNIEIVAHNASDPVWFDPRFARFFAVSPAGKLSLTWGFLKRQ